jgi:hypothetical protein
MNYPSAGLSNSQEYQMSGFPYVANTTGSLHVEFQNVTRSFTISASGSNAYVYFSGSAGSATKFMIPAGTSIDFPLRVRELWFETSGSASLCAALTVIPRNRMFDFDSTKWSGV